MSTLNKTITRGKAVWLVVLIAVTALSTPAHGKPAGPDSNEINKKLDAPLQRAIASDNPNETIQVLISVSAADAKKIAPLVESLGGEVGDYSKSAKMLPASVQVNDVITLANEKQVHRISLDAPMRAPGPGPAGPGPGGPKPAGPGPAGPGPAGPAPAPIAALSLVDQPPITPDVLRQIVGASDSSLTGNGIGVAIIDSGIANIPDFAGRIRAFYDFTKGGKATAPSDEYGHGTHIAGLIGSAGKQTSGRFAGLAPNVQFIGLKVLDADGNGKTKDVISAIDFAIENKAKLGIDVINLSIGHAVFEPIDTDPLVQVVEAAVKAGIVVVVAAGNDGQDATTGEILAGTIESPANAPSVITVGAVKTLATIGRNDDRVADYSSRGPTLDGLAKPDLVAPGYRLVSNAVGGETILKDFPSWQYPTPPKASGAFLRLTGTSMAASVVTGVVALVLEVNRADKNPDGSAMARFTPADVKAVLMYTATATVGADAMAEGAGEVNAAGAIAMTRSLDTRWTPWLAQATTQATTIGGQTQPWGSDVLWGNFPLTSTDRGQLVWTAHTLSTGGAAWGEGVTMANATHIVWGNALVSANATHVVWGNDFIAADATHIVWGNATHIVWGNATHVVWGNATHIVWGNARHIVWGNSCGLAEICY